MTNEKVQNNLLNSKKDLKSILKIPLNSITDLIIILKELNNIVECQTSGIFIKHHNKLIYIAAYGKSDYKLLNQSLTISESVEGKIFSNNAEVLIEKSIDTDYFKPNSSSSNIILPMTIVGAPIFHEEKTIGGIIAFNRVRNTLFTDKDLAVLKKTSLYIADILASNKNNLFDKKLYHTNKEIVDYMPFPLFICSTKGDIEEFSIATSDLLDSDNKNNLYGKNIKEILKLINNKNELIDIEKITENIINLKDAVEINNVRFPKKPEKTYNLIIKYINPDRMIHNLLFYLINTEDVNAVKQQLITSVAHELRTPMTAIMGAVQILLSDFDSSEVTPTQKEFLSILKSQSERFSTILSTIIDYKETTDSLGLKEEKTNLFEVINEIEVIFSEKLKSKNVKIEKINIEKDMIVKGEIYSIKHIYNQIIDNAIKFSPDNSTITIKNEGSRLDNSKWYKVVSINDEGPGIDEKILPTIFDSFSRHDEAVHTKIGTGLGLSIVKQLVDTMGGYIEVGNLENGGAIITISFLT